MRKILSVIFVLLLIALVSFLPGSTSSSSAKPGSIAACWAPFCPSAPDGPLTILLKDEFGNTVASCTLTSKEACCVMTGDFKTGTYHFEYFKPSGSHICTSAKFDYVNGTDVKKFLICNCN